MKIAAFVLLALVAAMPAQAQGPAPPAGLSSAAKARDNPGVQYLLMKTVVAKSIGIQKTRALPVEAGGYNLLKYCWSSENVLGAWGESAGLTGEMAVRALETLSWSRDLARAGYPEGQVAELIGGYEADLIAAGFTEAARTRALEALRTALQSLQLRTPGTSDIVARVRCNRQPSSFGLNVATSPEGAHARFMPYVLHQFCLAQQIDPADAVRCDYWQSAKAEGPMSFAGETAYTVTWPDNVVTTGRFNPDEYRATGTVTLRQRPPKN